MRKFGGSKNSPYLCITFGFENKTTEVLRECKSLKI